MRTLTIELPSQQAQRAFNERRWAELLRDPDLARIEGRVETDRYGRIILTPPSGPRHGSLQAEIAYLLRVHARGGRVLTECPVSTADGVKGADVAWASADRVRQVGDRACFPRAPEICVEVRSPGNTDQEIREKTALYFDAGAQEVWICAEDGTMAFLLYPESVAADNSRIIPDFPTPIVLSD